MWNGSTTHHVRAWFHLVQHLTLNTGNVLFADANTVKRLLVGMGTPLPHEDQMQSLDMQDPTSAVYLWYKVCVVVQ